MSILGLLTGCFGPSKQEIIAKEKAKKERQLKYKKIRDDRVEVKIQAKKLLDKKKAEDKAKQDATVIALGYGNTKEQALKNAFSTAVSEYVGVLVDSKEVTKNGKLIEDKILTFSNGYIDKYNMLSSKEQMGLWEIKISAVIKQQQVLAQIKRLKIKAINIKNSENRYAKIISQVKSKFDAEDMLIDLVKESKKFTTIKKYINIKIDNLFIDTDLATRTSVPITIKYSILFNWNEYKKITDKFEKLFIKIGAKKIGTYSIVDRNKNYPKVIDSVEPRILNPRIPNDLYKDLINEPVINIVTKVNSLLMADKWLFPRAYSVVYPFSNQESWAKGTENKNYHLLLIDNNGKKSKISLRKGYDKVASYESAIFRSISHHGKVYWESDYPWGNKMLISPLLKVRTRNTLYSYGSMATFSNNLELLRQETFTFDVSLEIIKNLKQAKIEWD